MENYTDEYLSEQLTKLLCRIERILIPRDQIVAHSANLVKTIADLTKCVQSGLYFEDANAEVTVYSSGRRVLGRATLKANEKANVTQVRRVKWVELERDIVSSLAANGSSSVKKAYLQQVFDEVATEREHQQDEEARMRARISLKRLHERNGQPAMPGAWRKKPFQRRKYDRIKEYVPTNSVTAEESQHMMKQLKTPLDGFLGQAYNLDDHELTEEWMLSFKDAKKDGPSDDDVVKTQIEILLEIMTGQVQDRVCNTNKVLQRPVVGLGARLKEAPVWGIDSYVRKMIELTIEDHVSEEYRSKQSVRRFIEKRLLPAINAQSPQKAHNMTYALDYILEDQSTSVTDKRFAEAIYPAVEEKCSEHFKIHPKGTGIICTDSEGIAPHTVVSEYLGELYPPYRWCERMDVVDQAQKSYELKPALPDFYNILLERPRQDPNGYGLLYVDASQRANMGSSCSHSCDANCTSAVVAKEGQLKIVLTTLRHIYPGEELTMDYYSITFSDDEWRAAVCLCGSCQCRGSFLQYATQDDMQQVLNQNCGPLWRYASLLRACSAKPLIPEDEAALDRHGMRSVVLGDSPANWIKKYAADNLRFVEFERKALPCALMRPREGQESLYSYSAADLDARSVMEQRIQSMVCCISMVQRVLVKQPDDRREAVPLRTLQPTEAAKLIFERLNIIPDLIDKHCYVQKAPKALKSAKNDENIKLLENVSGSGNVELCEAIRAAKEKIAEQEKAAREKAEAQERAKWERLREGTDGMRALLRPVGDRLMDKPDGNKESAAAEASLPVGLPTMRQLCLELRKLVISIESFAVKSAQLRLLSDILCLWAHTTNFSQPQAYVPIQSDEIVVPARELGNGIPRAKFFKNDVYCRSIKNANGMLPSTIDESSTDVGFGTASPSDTAATDSEMGSNRTNSPGEVNAEECAEPFPDVAESETMSASGEDMQDESQDRLAPNKESLTYFDPNDPIFTGKKMYGEMFTFWQLMGWYDAGTGSREGPPELFGCVQLPLPEACFGDIEQVYGKDQREELLKLLKNERMQMQPWPEKLRACFAKEKLRCDAIQSKLLGSPMLDVTLGRVDSVAKALAEMVGAESKEKVPAKNGKSRGKKSKSVPDEDDDSVGQLDDILPPELPSEWVQCDDCHKWRRVAWDIDINGLPDEWVCSMNTWDPERASCEVPQDAFDPEAENAVNYQLSAADNAKMSDAKEGDWFDVFCSKNLVYYEGQIQKVKVFKQKDKANPKGPQTEVKKFQFHFRGWSSKFDEWVEADSDRIKAHNLFTNPDASSARDQEKYQGNTRLIEIKEAKENKKRRLEEARAARAAEKAREEERKAKARRRSSAAARKRRESEQDDKGGDGDEKEVADADADADEPPAKKAAKEVPVEDDIEYDEDDFLDALGKKEKGKGKGKGKSPANKKGRQVDGEGQ
jgi:hypothetical protein